MSELLDRSRCICVDMRGHGDSDKLYTGYSYSELCNDIRALLPAPDTEAFGLDAEAAATTLEGMRIAYPEFAIRP